MSFFDKLKEEFSEKSRRRKQDQEVIDKLKLEAEVERKIVFEKKMRVKLIKDAKDRALRDVEKKTGLQRFKAQNRVRNIEKLESNPGGRFSKLSEYTQRNLAKTQERREKNDQLQKALREEREKKIGVRGVQPTWR